MAPGGWVGRMRNKPRIWTEQTLRDRCVEEGECLLWTQTVNSAGHPTASINGRNWLVRRYAYQHLYGKSLGPNLLVCSRCENVRCCSRLCLLARTKSVHLTKCFEVLMENPAEYHRRQQFSVSAGFARLTQAKADEIRMLKGKLSGPKVGAQFGVSSNAVYNVWSGNSWRPPRMQNSVFNLGGNHA
jgi:hypothetical protein